MNNISIAYLLSGKQDKCGALLFEINKYKVH